MIVSFNVSGEEAQIIKDIALRAHGLIDRIGVVAERVRFVVDVTVVHVNGCPLKLQELLDAPETDFIHDLAGIRRHLDRATGKLDDGFLPRCAKR